MGRKVPVYEKKGSVFLKVGEADPDELAGLLCEPDTENITAVYIVRNDIGSAEGEKPVHEFKIDS